MKTLFVALLAVLGGFIPLANAQSIQSGATFEWEDTQTSGDDPATLQSVTIDGSIFDTLSLPTDYEMIQVGPGGDTTNRIRRNGTTVETSSTSLTWDDSATQAFSSRNLNFFFEADRRNENAEICNNLNAIPTTSNQIQRLSYGAGIPATVGSILAVTERNANNCYYLRIFGIPVGGGPEQEIGGTFVNGGSVLRGSEFRTPEPGSDYWSSGRITGNNGTIGIALFVLDPLVQAGSIITAVDFIAATRDHGDGKLFIMNTSAPITANDDVTGSVDSVTGATNVINVLSNDSLRNFPPTASSATISILMAASDPQVTLDVTTGNVNVAAGVMPGDYEIVYEICETASPTNCDTAVVTIPVVGLIAMKKVTVVSDPVNGTLNPMAVPGALLRYCLLVVNRAGSASADNITITDVIDGMPVTFVPGSIRVDVAVENGDCDFSTGSVGGKFTGTAVIASLSDIPPNQSSAFFFDVTIN